MLRPYTVLYYNTVAFEASARRSRSEVRAALGGVPKEKKEERRPRTLGLMAQANTRW